MAKQMLCFKLVIFAIIVALIFQDIYAQSSLDCNFNTGFCEWKQDQSDDVDWKRRKTLNGGHAIFVDESKFGRGLQARLSSSMQMPGQNCLTFSYGMSGRYKGVLSVSLSYSDENEEVIFQSAIESASAWWKRAVISLNSSLEYEVVIEGRRAYSFFDNTIWLDDILLEHGLCTDCDFDFGFCYWTNLDWELQKSKNGPIEDHTTGNGQYIYIDSTVLNDTDKAFLIGPFESPGKYCISFWFYMHGGQVDRLGLWVLKEQSGIQNIRNITKSHAEKWIYNNNIIESTEKFQIAFEAHVTSDNGVIAIDDVLLLSCQDCLDPSPQYGHLNDTSFQYGSSLEITCDTGYNLTGSPFTVCQDNGVWSNIPKCDLIDCGNRTIINGMFKAYDGTTFGSTATQICDKGYDLVGNAIVNCTTFGWSSPETGCILVDCGDPSPVNGQVNATTFHYGSIVEIACDTGYNLTGSPFIECQANGVWSNITKCDPFDCGNRTIINGLFSADDGTTFGRTATQICDTDYSLVGNAKVRCTTLGWSSPEARCEIAEEGKSALIAIYAVVPAILVAFAIVIVIIFLRKRHPKCMNRTNKCKTALNRPYFNETYNGETPQGQIYANMSNADEPYQSTEEYAVSTDCTNHSVKYSNNGTYKYDVNDTYDHTLNAPKAFEDTTYSHISGKRSNHTDESSYDTTHYRLASSTNDDNCYNVINNTKHIETATSHAKKLIEEPDYDHANAGGPDPTSGDFDDYSHVNRSENNANIAGMKSTTGYEQQDKHTPKYTVEKEKENDDNRPNLKLEAEKMSGGYCEEENHTYFVLEKTEN